MELPYLEPLHVLPADFPAEPELPEGCREIKIQDDPINVTLKTNVVYAEKDGMPLHLHVFMPTKGAADPTKYPLIIYITGSAWLPQDMDQMIPDLCAFAKRGYCIASVQYRPSVVAPFPAQIEDTKTAMRFMRLHAEEYHADVTRTAYFGASSGGHTALFCGFTGDDSPLPDLYPEYSCASDVIVDWFGPTDFPVMNTRPSLMDHVQPNSPEGLVLGRVNVRGNMEKAAEANPRLRLSAEKDTPPVLMMHGDRDILVPFHQSILVYNRLRELHKDVEFYKLLDASHGFNGFQSTAAYDLVDEFLRRKLRIT